MAWPEPAHSSILFILLKRALILVAVISTGQLTSLSTLRFSTWSRSKRFRSGASE